MEPLRDACEINAEGMGHTGQPRAKARPLCGKLEESAAAHAYHPTGDRRLMRIILPGTGGSCVSFYGRRINNRGYVSWGGGNLCSCRAQQPNESLRRQTLRPNCWIEP